MAAGYCCAVIVGSLTGVLTLLGPEMIASAGAADRQWSLLRLPLAAAFLAAEFFPFLFVAAFPFTLMVTVLLLSRSRQSGWLPFVLLGGLCPATVVFAVMFLLGPGHGWDFSTTPPRKVAYDGWMLLAKSVIFIPAGAAAGLVYWLVGFSPARAQEAHP